MSIAITIIYYNNYIKYQNINLGINILGLKKWFDNCAKYDHLIVKIQALERLTTDNIQVWERPTNENKKNIHKQAKEFRIEPTASLHYETNEEPPKVIRTPILIYPVTMQEWPPDDRKPQSYAEVNWNHVEMLDLRRF